MIINQGEQQSDMRGVSKLDGSLGYDLSNERTFFSLRSASCLLDFFPFICESSRLNTNC